MTTDRSGSAPPARFLAARAEDLTSTVRMLFGSDANGSVSVTRAVAIERLLHEPRGRSVAIVLARAQTRDR